MAKTIKAADMGRARDLLVSAKSRAISITCDDAEHLRKIANTFHVSRWRNKVEGVHVRCNDQEFLVELVPVAALTRQRLQRRQALVAEHSKRVLPRAISHVKTLARRVAKKGQGEGASDYLMFVGALYYPTSGHFIREAVTFGCSKRINEIPRGLRVGQSRVFLVHSEGAPTTRERKDGDPTGFIFASFLVNKIDLIIQTERNIAKSRDWIEQANVRLIAAADTASEPTRGGGERREPGALYLVDKPGEIDILTPPEPYYGPVFRAIKKFDAGKLGHRPDIVIGNEQPEPLAEEPKVEEPKKEKPKKEKSKRGREPSCGFAWRPSNKKLAGDILYFCDACCDGFYVAEGVTPPCCPRCEQTDQFALSGEIPPYLQELRNQRRAARPAKPFEE